ncbi:uncharacterized protein LOC119683831 [Teleopsis dalmanni]|uniref:uncharacterized protein LOC119683831 n=1 Tax=Teleopsis dalmanni TaxID=139649 RepID=UPI0018CF4F11|nr:uncharacterized protein LOC119683831 [Teleopsis dalmanni]
MLVLMTGAHQYIYQIDDYHIEVNETDFKCDKIFCPEETERCEIDLKLNDENKNELFYINTCYGDNDTVLEQDFNLQSYEEAELINLTGYKNGSVILITYQKVSKPVMVTTQQSTEESFSVRVIAEKVYSDVTNIASDIFNKFGSWW